MLSSLIFFLGCLAVALIAALLVELVWVMLLGPNCEGLREYLLYLLIVWLLLTGCHQKRPQLPLRASPPPQTQQPTQAERCADSLANAFNRAHRQTQAPLNHYENDLKSYDSIPVLLH